METFIIYLLKVNIPIILFYGLYRLLLQRDTFFRSKRILLLFIYIFSIFYPFIHFSFNTKSLNPTGKALMENIPVFTLPEVVISSRANSNIYPLITVLYIIGAALVLLWILIQLTSIAIHIHRSNACRLHGVLVNISKRPTSPYSFFNRIVIDEKTKDKSDLQEILLHEKTHIRQIHSADVLFSQFVLTLCWFNPFVWLMNREIRMNLEFLVDRTVLKSGCEPEHYQFHLLRLSYQKAAANLSNNFNFSPLKKRIQMMNKQQTSGFGYAKYILFIPLVATLLLINNAYATAKMNVPSIAGNVEFTQPDMAFDVASAEVQKDSIFAHVEVMPQFPGGDKAMMEYLFKNLKYPVSAKSEGIQGSVVVRFVITSTGKIENVEVLRSVDPALDQESIRLVHSMPDWTPGKQGGKAVAVYYNLPIRYKLSDDTKNKKEEKNTDVKADVVVTAYGDK